MRKITMLLAFLLFLGVQWVNAQEREITGTVTSYIDGSGLPGVSIVVKGTTIGTITDADGKYTIKVPSDATTLVFSFVGMVTEEIAIGTQSVIDVTMIEDILGLDEVVVTAFGISRDKKAITYQTETVSGDDLNSAQSSSAAIGLVAKVAGVQVNVQDNGVKPKTQIILRGLRSISGNNEALIVIDGAIATAEAFSDLNPNDIESINTLKGATAAALYGSNAMNGAMIVTTKSGRKNERFTVGITHSSTFEKVAYMPDFQTEYGTGWDGVYDEKENTNWGPRFDGTMRQIGPVFPDGLGTVLGPDEYQEVPYEPVQDNLLDFFNTGSTIQNTVYMTGGDETSSFYFSLGNQNTKGVVPDDVYQKNNVRANARKRIGSVELAVNTNYSFDEKDVVGDQIGDQDRAFYWFLLNTPANIPLSDYSDWDNPESFGYADNYFNAYYQNPYWAVGTNRDMDKTNRFIGNASASWDIVENINFTTRFGANSVSGSGKNWRAYQEYNEVLQPYHSTVASFVEEFEFQQSTFTIDGIVQGDFNLTEDFSLKAILGTAVYMNERRESMVRGDNLSIDGFYDLSNATGVITGDLVDQEQKRTFGVFGDVTVGFRSMAFLQLSGRQDYTSTLPKENNSYFYPAAGLTVLLNEAIPALGGFSPLSMAKITLNNSVVYNDLDPYEINERYNQVDIYGPHQLGFPFPYTASGVNGFLKDKVTVDENIKKEKLNSTEIGLNTAFFNGRLLFDATYFTTVTTDLITATTPSVASASETFLTNIGKLKGSGYELTIGGKVLKMGDLSWDVNLNYYHYETIVEEIKGDIEEIAIDAYAAGYGTYAVKDEAFPQLKAVGYERTESGKIVVDRLTGNPVVGELQNMGKTTPDYIVGLSSAVNWKGISLSATFDYRTGHVYYSQGSDQMEFTGRSMECIQSNRQDFVWPNSVYVAGYDASGEPIYEENTNIPITGGIMDFWQNQYNNIKENYVKDASALKLRELSLNYTLPKSILDKAPFLQKVTVGIVGRNLFTVLPYEMYSFSDPEFRNTRDEVRDDPNGIGIGGYFAPPPSRTFGFSLNVEF